LLAPVAALGLLPLATARVESGTRRGLVVVLGVLTAAVVAGVRHAALPFTGAPAPLGAGVAGATGPFDVAGSLARAAAAHPALLLETGALAAVAVLLPYACRRGRWGAVVLGASMLGFTVLAVPSASPLPLVLAAWAVAAVAAYPATARRLTERAAR
jgi:hypothetical protein